MVDPTPTAPVDVELPGRISRSPDPRKLRRRRSRFTGRAQSVFDRLFVPAEIQDEFAQPLDELWAELRVKHSATAHVILAEAEAYFSEAADRIESAERRATALQGTVAIAASLVVAGAGLLLDTTKIGDQEWRAAFASMLALFTVCLLGCVWRALGA